MVHAAVQGPSDRRWRGIQKRWTPCTRNLLRGDLQTAPVLLTSKDHVSICMSFIHSPKTHTSLWGSCHVVGTVSSTRDTLVNETLPKSSRNSLVMEGMGTNHIMTFVVQLLSHVWLFWDPWIPKDWLVVVHQPPLSLGFSRQEYWSGLPFPSLIMTLS